jgi:adenylate cyclase
MFDALMQKADGVVEKVRFEIPYGLQTIELDVYTGAHEGLVVAEVEFSNNAETDLSPWEQVGAFMEPRWFGQDVTEDKAYKNKNLATEGLPSSPNPTIDQ